MNTDRDLSQIQYIGKVVAISVVKTTPSTSIQQCTETAKAPSTLEVYDRVHARQLGWNTNADHPHGIRGWNLLIVSPLTEWQTRQRRTNRLGGGPSESVSFDHEIDVPVAIKRQTSLSLRVTRSLG